MDPLLDYAPRRKRAPGQLACAIGDAMGRIAILLLLTLVAALVALPLLKDHASIERYKDEHYWLVLLNGWGYEVDRNAGDIIYVWNGLDSHIYFRIDASAAAARADRCAQEFVQTRIGYLQNARVAHGDGSAFATELRAITGEDFKEDGDAWQNWATTHLGAVKGGEAAYRRLQDARLAAARSANGKEFPLPDFRDPYFREAQARSIYLSEVNGFWFKPIHWLEAALLALYPVTLVLLARRHYVKRRLQQRLIN